MEIAPLTFGVLQSRLLEHLRYRIRNGELTERSLARLTGISQPHVHNVLKGVRAISVELADVILTSLRLSPLDLLPRDQITAYLTRTSEHRQSRLHPVPVLSGLLGLHQPIPRKGPQREVHTVPYHLTEAATEPLVASLAADLEMEPLFAHRDLVLLDQSEVARAMVQSEGYYVVRTSEGPCVRALRHVGETLYLISEKNRADAESWPQLTLTGRNILDIVLARVIWLNRRRRWEDHVA
jgi:transcriptional regulator with XRE-family HTH domain